MAQSEISFESVRDDWEPYQGGDISVELPWDGGMKFKTLIIEEGGVSKEGGNEMIKLTAETFEASVSPALSPVIKYVPYTGTTKKKIKGVEVEVSNAENIFEMLYAHGRTMEELKEMKAKKVKLSVENLHKNLTTSEPNKVKTDHPKNVWTGNVKHQTLESGQIASSVDFMKPEVYAERMKSPSAKRKVVPSAFKPKGAKRGVQPNGVAGGGEGGQKEADF